jgi:hypothetical protein
MSEYEKQHFRYCVSKFRVKIKSLAEEARIIRDEEKKRTGWVRCGLHAHRIGTVRYEQRHTLLAYAYLRGIPYGSLEVSPASKPSPLKIKTILKSLTQSSEYEDGVSGWLKETSKTKAA